MSKKSEYKISLNKEDSHSIILTEDAWDDYHFETQFHCQLVNEEGILTELGYIKIGQYGLQAGSKEDAVPGKIRKPEILINSTGLEESLFSLGQEKKFYQTIVSLGTKLTTEILSALNDIVYNEIILKKSSAEEVTIYSLHRFVPLKTVQDVFVPIVGNVIRKTSMRIDVNLRKGSFQPNKDRVASFVYDKNSIFPSHLHSIIGQNGSGKSTLLDDISVKYTPGGNPENQRAAEASGLNIISFSAFDGFGPKYSEKQSTKMRYRYIGLKQIIETDKYEIDCDYFETGENEGQEGCQKYGMKDQEKLNQEIFDLYVKAIQPANEGELSTVFDLLERHKEFNQSNIFWALQQSRRNETGRILLEQTLNTMSSGHRIVLLSCLALIVYCKEGSLTLIDEPETHLHPPLLSTFILVFSNILSNRNAMGIVATHSPVVVQELPRECVHIISRDLNGTYIRMPEIETYGENVGVLTQEIFGLEVRSTGFFEEINNICRESSSPDDALKKIDRRVGSEATFIIIQYFMDKSKE